MSLAKVLGVTGTVLVFVGGVVDLLLALNHRGHYWREYLRRFGIYLLLGAVLALVGWIVVSFLTGLLILEATGLLACAGIYLFDNWRGKLPRSLVGRLKGTATLTVVVGVVITAVALLVSSR